MMPQTIADRVYALIFNGLTRATTEADEHDWMRLSERERLAEAVYAELRAGNIEFRLGPLALLAETVDSCTCTVAGPDPACPVHQGRRARGPKPPNPPGCICDGSGRTCLRHGAVL